MMHDPLPLYASILFEAFGKELGIKDAQLIAAGNLNQGTALHTDQGSFFLKMAG